MKHVCQQCLPFQNECCRVKRALGSEDFIATDQAEKLGVKQHWYCMFMVTTMAIIETLLKLTMNDN